MKEKAYIIPKGSRLYAAAVVCMILQFTALALMNVFYFDNHIPFFGNIVGETHGFFVFLLINDILYFLSCVLQVLGMLLARKNLWVLSGGWLCSLLLQIWQNIIFGGAGTISFNSAAVCALVFILAQTGNIRSRKAAVIPFVVCGAVSCGNAADIVQICGARAVFVRAECVSALFLRNAYGVDTLEKRRRSCA